MLFSKMVEMNHQINELYEEKRNYKIALVGNPNVGKSTVFNALTGMKQHTGNWAGKTVSIATGEYIYDNQKYTMIDLPGTYSLMAHSKEEEVTRDYICFEKYDVCVVVCDSTCLERNLNLVLQTLEITSRVVLCLNLMDEANKKKIEVHVAKLKKRLGIEVVSMSARHQVGFEELKKAIKDTAYKKYEKHPTIVVYDEKLEEILYDMKASISIDTMNQRFFLLKLLDPSIQDARFYEYLEDQGGKLEKAIQKGKLSLQEQKLDLHYEELIVNKINEKAKEIAQECIQFHDDHYLEKDMRLDRILTHKVYGVLIMLCLLSFIFWITISASNVPGQWLSDIFHHIELYTDQGLSLLHVSPWLKDFLTSGVLRTTGWVISVMLPPMAIFFPLFTLLEDFGYLPRIAFNLDRYFHKAKTCGKQALTMCMGFGCNAVGVSGCRIIDSPRERLVAILTNNFVPCNGRFPTLIAIISMFFTGMLLSPWDGIFSTLLLTGVIILGILLTFGVSSWLSKTILKGVPSSFTLELPPYRKPQFGKVILRSIFDRTLFVLGRAISAAIPAGAILWIMANVQIAGIPLLQHASTFLDPIAYVFGLDGVILLAFILGFPANEIVIPIMIMAYMSNGYMIEFEHLSELKALLVANGWTWITAICTMLFSLIHFPCATTCMTIKKETGSWKWTCIAFLLPTIIGLIVCFIVANVARVFM
ncbi:MAG: ferrous iron transport protein B [Erysipelotrichaceae bacterium]|nr:ferrous iron transport protein B [Erysipelotrichaceae bacterium]